MFLVGMNVYFVYALSTSENNAHIILVVVGEIMSLITVATACIHCSPFHKIYIELIAFSCMPITSKEDILLHLNTNSNIELKYRRSDGRDEIKSTNTTTLSPLWQC